MKALLRLLPYYHRHLAPLWIGNALLLVARIFEALIPQLLSRGIDGLTDGTAPLGWLGLGIVALIAARFVAIFFGRRAVRRLGIEVAYDLRRRLYDQLQNQGTTFYGRHRTGDLMARAINDIGLIRRVVAQGTRTVVVLLFSSFVAFGFMLAESPSLTLLLIPPMPVIFVVAWWMSRRLYRESVEVQEGFSGLSDRVQENLGGIRTVQALNQEEREMMRFAVDNRSYLDRNLALLRTNSILGSVMPGLGSMSVLIVLYFGGMRVVSEDISLGTFTAFIWYLNMVVWPVREAGNMINLFQRGAAGCARLFEILDAEPEITDSADPEPDETLRGEISFRDVVVRHDGAAEPALDHVSFDVHAGETVAILGRVGSGKSTLLHLMVRLIDPEGGSVLLDGRPLHEHGLSELRRQVAIVPQEAFLFSESVRENLSYDDPERPHALLEAAATAADFDDTIAGFPEAWETPVGERGVLLSGGQKQRLTLARALVRPAAVLLLDDPFASVDAETEERILGRLASRRRGTTLLVTHRVAAARLADRIVVLEEGRVAESGTPAELRARDGIFANMERVQTRARQLEAQLDAGGSPA